MTGDLIGRVSQWEYLVNKSDKFCANLPLFVANNVKLIGAACVLGMDLLQQFPAR